MEQYITGGLIGSILGSLITIIVQGIINYLTERKRHKRELSKMVFSRKIEIAEHAMAWLQTSNDSVISIRLSILEIVNNTFSQASIDKITVAAQKAQKMSEQTLEMWNPIYLYYDFSDIEDKYKVREHVLILNQIGNNIMLAISSNNDIYTSISEVVTANQNIIMNSLNDISQMFIEVQKRLREDYKL